MFGLTPLQRLLLSSKGIIEQEVIETDIQRYLEDDASAEVTKQNREPGCWIIARRELDYNMIVRLK
ncbi:hypothetical protein K432DRAFT_379811 [Lepidopterella palustris CBS 459.81]|uniref:Uncharacterized protein n=1 Tax=Lepidopterella palustris CBS 459.81 TaxID=1314670 RepID=A0A8E2EFR4_9PEZI|nr:hypothetical protein K432DRAFT_379811 [Lepidopterella palustris CBS 459.81]